MRMEGCLDLGGTGVGPDGGDAQCEDVLVATGLVFSQGEPAEGYGLELEVVSEHADGDLSGLTTFRLYMQTAHETDRVVAAVGDDEYPLSLMPENAFYQNPFGNNNPEGISPAWISFFPDLAFDSWITIGLDGPSSSSAGEEGVTMLFASGWESVFGSGQGFVEDSESGSGWTVIPWTATNTIAGPDLRVLLAQLTTDGDMSGSMRVQVFPQSDNENDLRLDVWFDTDVVCGCTDPVAMNYDAGANYNDGSCLYPGCIHVLACNFDPGANVDDGSCLYLNDCGECVNTCLNDLDDDGICDDVDDCVGEFDACGICNGPGAVFDCGCSALPPGDCDCDGNQLDALGVCGGDCVADADGDGVCDVDDDCVGQYDACGICNGPGQVYECGCANIPAGDCDCDGNQLDVLGVCGGDCVADADGDGVCDVDDDCVGQYDACGICNGPGQVYECGCANIPAGDCDCDGNQLDVLGVCGGACVADADGDGVWTSTTIASGSMTPAASATGGRRVRVCQHPSRRLRLRWEPARRLGCVRRRLRGGCGRSDIVDGSTTPAASATDLDRSTSAGVPTSPPAIAIAAGTSSTSWACAEATAWPTPMAMASVTSTTIVSGSTTRAASATGLDRSTSADAPTSPPATAIATGTSSTCSVWRR